LITELAEDLPWTMADSYQLQQVFLNIVNNAHQAMTEAGAGGVLTVRSELTAGNAIRVSFTDTGPGIPSDVLDQVFDPFFTTKEVGVGTGLGLSVSHGIVQEHGGRIWAESQLGRGATFFVELPVRSWIEDLALPSAEYGTERIPPAGKRIMVVDDDRSTVELVVRALTDSGYRVDGVTSARLALDRLRWVRYDLMICDIRMPEISGVEWESEVRAMDPELLGRMVFITGDLLSPSTQGFLDRWQGRHINKPFDVDELRALVRDALEGEAGG
jgi:two-component system NtrC family sensor kinase